MSINTRIDINSEFDETFSILRIIREKENFKIPSRSKVRRRLVGYFRVD